MPDSMRGREGIYVGVSDLIANKPKINFIPFLNVLKTCLQRAFFKPRIIERLDSIPKTATLFLFVS